MTGTVSVAFRVPGNGAGGSAARAPSVSVARGTSVLDAAVEAGLGIDATCGKRGRCRSCRVRLVQGKFSPPSVQDRLQLGADAVNEGFRLGCKTEIVEDCEVQIAPPREEAGHQIFRNEKGERYSSVVPSSGVQKHLVRAEAPLDEHKMTSDLEEILSQLPPETERAISLDVMRKTPAALRDKNGELTVTTFNDRIIDLEAGDTAAHIYGMAFDIGTTSVVGSLHDLVTGEELATVGGLNPQAVHGGDLMSRIAYAQFDDKKLQTLRGTILKAINEYIDDACHQAGISPAHIYKIVVVGNTCMHHIFLGIDTTYVGLAPYAPVWREAVEVAASEVPLKSAKNARVCLLPIIAGFVGADTVGAVLASRIHESDTPRVLVDIGTNGEVVMGDKHRLVACSAPAGPALEGGEISQGMRGADGAIEGIAITDDISLRVIGDMPPIGICGSGLIDAVAQMLDAGVLETDGRLARKMFEQLPQNLQARFNDDEKIRSFILAYGNEAGHGTDIVLTQMDVRALQLAKGAIYAGIAMLQKVMNVPDDDLAEVLLCGGFGNYINLESAKRIRLLPDLPEERISYIGNAALVGAELALLSEEGRREADRIVARIEHVALATHLDFQLIFVDACRFEGLNLTGNAV